MRSQRRPGKRQTAVSQPMAVPTTAPKRPSPATSSKVPRTCLSPSNPSSSLLSPLLINTSFTRVSRGNRASPLAKITTSKSQVRLLERPGPCSGAPGPCAGAPCPCPGAHWIVEGVNAMPSRYSQPACVISCTASRLRRPSCSMDTGEALKVPNAFRVGLLPQPLRGYSLLAAA